MKIVKVPEDLYDELMKIKVENRLTALWKAIRVKRRCHLKISDEELNDIENRLRKVIGEMK